MLKSFRIGGIHPHDNKLSRAEKIVAFPLAETVVIPLAQHIGAPAEALVAKGDKVLVGDLIGKSTGFVSANIHSSVSGTVTAVGPVANALGIMTPSVTIKVEGDEWNQSIDRTEDLVAECNLEAKEIIKKISDAGIVGMGGATFPSHVKLSIPEGKVAECLIINGVECEPYLTSDHRVMLEMGEKMMIGTSILAKAIGAKNVYVGIENNKKDAIAHLQKLSAIYKGIEIVPLKVQYPQGSEKQLIDAVVGRQVKSGALPIDAGAVVQNSGTAVAVYDAVQKNKPLFERVVTITGKGVERPANLMVRIGTPVSALIEHCGGLGENTGKVISGGPMMGRPMSNLDSPVTKGTSGVLLMQDKEALRPVASYCIKCGKCVDACAMGLEPYMLGRLGALGKLAQMEEYEVTDCIECGSCSYTCPANLPLLDYIRLGKVEVMKIKRNRK